MDYQLAGHKYKAIDLEEYTLPGDLSDDELEEYLGDPLYRICNLYSIVDKNAKRVQFRPNWPQRVVLHAIFIEGFIRIAVPKARQLGFSTLFEVILFDACYWNDNYQASIVDQTQGDASEKLHKVRFAWEEMDPELKDSDRPEADNNKEMTWTNGSSVNAGKNARGGTNQLLHISEWGPIAWEDPKRSEEIITGAIPSVPKNGLIFAESTFKGGKGGDWYNLLQNALKTHPEQRTTHDYLVLFFPWYIEPEYTLYGEESWIDKDCLEYLNKKEQELGIRFTTGQKVWYFKEWSSMGDKMLQEYPTTIEEMWQVREAGLIYAEALDKQRAKGKVNAHVQYYAGMPVYTAWDIGLPINTKVWCFQVIGDRILLLDALSGGPECQTPGDWAGRLRSMGYNFGGHFLPHDGEVMWKRMLEEAGIANIVCCSRATSVWDPINDALTSFSRCEFSTVGCGGEDGGISALDYYHCKEERDGKTVKPVPVHDWSSHFSSAFATIFQAIRQGLLVDRSAIPAKHDNPRLERITVTGVPRRA